ncbi:hypothetical protein [Enterobacter hormaechei]|uniref:hypothetical protein n=1 Tax=Enterobacter hormaechei TaxID=158836 RepID=UPI00345BB16B
MYQETIHLLKKTQSVAKHLTELGKILTSTEDPQLKELVETVYGSLQEAHYKAKSGKSTPLNLYSAQNNTIKRLISYCESHIQAGKPEWQVMAEKNGWTPPASS